MTRAWFLPLLLSLSACDDTLFGPNVAGGEGGTDTTPIPEGYDGVLEIAQGECISCHSAGGGSGNLDLETDPCEATLGVQATLYDGVLVVAGDASSSVVWNKMAGTGVYGGVMPLSGALDAETVAIVEAWINSGANCNG